MITKQSKAKAYHSLYDTADWKRLRREQLDNSPLCAICLQVQRVSNACVVDHVKPHKGDVALFYNAGNLQSLCKHCHDSVKQKYERSGVIKGSDMHGNPLDKNATHWNR